MRGRKVPADELSSCSLDFGSNFYVETLRRRKLLTLAGLLFDSRPFKSTTTPFMPWRRLRRKCNCYASPENSNVVGTFFPLKLRAIFVEMAVIISRQAVGDGEEEDPMLTLSAAWVQCYLNWPPTGTKCTPLTRMKIILFEPVVKELLFLSFVVYDLQKDALLQHQ
ncbi:hypothetical protein TNCV_1091451 [Trichonephila clavipes]|nr:hypothetical protein TNCV_1091451 [Trichonephila clavipes]